MLFWGFPHSSLGKEATCNAGDPSSIPGLGRSPGEGTSSPLQYSCLENPMDREAWQTTVYGVARVGHDSDWTTTNVILGFPCGASGKETAGQYRRHKRCGFDPWIGNIPLEEGMATHSSILAWRIPWTEEPDGLQPMGSKESDATQWLTFKLYSPHF